MLAGSKTVADMHAADFCIVLDDGIFRYGSRAALFSPAGFAGITGLPVSADLRQAGIGLAGFGFLAVVAGADKLGRCVPGGGFGWRFFRSPAAADTSGNGLGRYKAGYCPGDVAGDSRDLGAVTAFVLGDRCEGVVEAWLCYP